MKNDETKKPGTSMRSWMQRVLKHRGNRLKHRYTGSFFLNSQSVTVNYMKQDIQYIHLESPSRKRNRKSKNSSL